MCSRIECFIDELAERGGQDPVAYRLSIASDPRARGVVEQVARRCAKWQRRARRPAPAGPRHRLRALQEPAGLCGGGRRGRGRGGNPPAQVWCAADAGLVINPDGAINQLEGGIIQSASWVLKEQVRLDGDGIASRDWESYPVLRFSEVPEIVVELVDAEGRLPPLGVGEATAGPTVAAIGNAVAHALGARIRDLPMTRERIMAALLK